MTRGWWIKFVLMVFVIALSVWTVVPTFLPESPKAKVDKEGKAAPEADLPWYYRILPSHTMKLGLDLKGGLSITIGIDTKKAIEAEAALNIDELKALFAKEGISVKSVLKRPGSSKLKVELSDPEQRKALLNLVRGKFSALEYVGDEDGLPAFDIKEERKKEIIRYTTEQTLEMQRKRLDGFGVSEPSIQKTGTDRILIQLPGVSDIERAQSILERTALLEFKLLDDTTPQADLKKTVEDAVRDGKLPENYRPADLVPLFEGKIPQGTQVLYGDEKDKTTQENHRVFYLLQSNALLTGKFLEDARITYGRFNEPVVGLSFNPTGAEIFKKVTTDNVDKRLAIILDDKVNSAPRIDEPIPNGRAQISFGGMMDRDSTLREAKDLSIVLKAGSLPAPVEVLESRVVGPTLGKDSIQAGSKATIIGVIIVVIFMLIYYGIAGLFADVALFLNLLFILAFMVAIDATLTLPGIAGMALTLGMAVDANVIINERVREELRGGKPIRLAVSTGFKRSFLCILDSNLTTLIAGFVLLNYGSGPVKGFAVTLIIGIIISFYTAFAIVQLLFELYLTKTKTERMYI